MAFRYEFINNNRLTDLQYLFGKVFHKKVSVDYLKAKYNTAYCGVEHKATIAYDGNLPIAFYGLIPQLFEANGEQFLVGHPCDYITHPEYQRKGIHSNLANKCYEELVKFNFRFVYAFQSELSHVSTKKLGWKEYGAMTATTVFTGGLPVAQLLDRLGNESFVYSKICKSLGDYIVAETDKNPVFDEGYFGQLYSEEFYKYKSFNKYLLLRIAGCNVWLKIDKVAYVGWFDAKDVAHFDKMMGTLSRALKNAGVNKMIFQTMANTQSQNLVKSKGKSVGSWKVGYRLFSETDIENFKFNFADFDTF